MRWAVVVTVHLHVVGVSPNGSPCAAGKHIPGALVAWSGAVGSCPQGGQVRTGANGVATIEISPLCYGPFTLEISATTPKGRFASMLQDGWWANPVQDVTWVLGVPGACDEGSAAADAGALLGGFGDVAVLLLLLGAVAVGGYIIYRIVRSPERRARIVEGGRSAVRYVRRR